MVEMKRIVTVTAERGKSWWVLEAPEAGSVSQVKRLSQADSEMREAIAYQLGIPRDSFEIDLKIQLPDGYRSALQEASELKAQANMSNRAAAQARRRAAHILADAHLTVRDIGEVMGISYQRAAQLLAIPE
jgi:hypothetical protein